MDSAHFSNARPDSASPVLEDLSHRSLLVDLRNCYEGFAGIPQELRLLFDMFSGMPWQQLGGLASGIYHRAPRETPPKDAFELVAQQTRMLIAQDEGRLPLPLLLRLMPGRLRRRLEYPFSALVTTGRDERLDREIDREIFEDYLWVKLFDKTLPPSRRGVIGRARFFATELGHENARHLTMLPGMFQKRLDSTGWDLFFAASVTPYKLPPSTRMVIRYYDALPLFSPHTVGDPWPHAASHGRMLQNNMQAGATFFCDSEPVRADVLRMFPRAEKRVHTIPAMLAPEYRQDQRSISTLRTIINRRASPATSAARPSPVPQGEPLRAADNPRLVMAVSTLEPRKNYLKLFNAFEVARRMADVPMKLLVVANPGWRSDKELAELKSLVKEGSAHHLAGVPIEELRILYSMAHCVVCPSRAEGFDYSGVESMACGTPVLASDIPVHRWVYGDAAEYFDAYNVEELASLIAQTVTLPAGEGHLGGMRDRGFRRAALYQQDVLAPVWQNAMAKVASERQQA
jgi:glycosyltransferase involved in cell wall biosynthesis